LKLSVKGYASFLRDMGHQVRESAGVHWFNTYPHVYTSFPFEKMIDPDALEVKKVLRSDGWVLRFPCEIPHGRTSYRLACSRRDYGLDILSGKARNQTRRGIEQCDVRQVSFLELARLGLKLNEETLVRQARKIPKDFSQYWQRYYLAASKADGAHAWGAFVEDELAAYLIAFEMDGVAHVLIVRSSSEFLRFYPNNALLFRYIQNSIGQEGFREVSIGLESIRSDMNSLDRFKLGMGFDAVPIGQRVQLAPWLGTFMRDPILTGLIKMARLRKQNEKTDKFVGLLQWYKDQRKHP
jgi:hypothetical protein